VAESSAGHTAPEKRSPSPTGLEKKLPEVLASLLKPENVKGRPVRLMFQDEARFGRMVRLRRCWAPAPLRPTVPNGYERQFIYAYGAVSPVEGQLDCKISSNMNTDRMNEFLCQVSAAHPDEFIVMVVDGASSHTSRDLRIPENICLLRLPPYSPELNPQEHVWDELREKEFPNRVFDSLEGVVGQLESGLRRLSADHEGLRSLTGWPWIVSINLIAT
jgi:transposase